MLSDSTGSIGEMQVNLGLAQILQRYNLPLKRINLRARHCINDQERAKSRPRHCKHAIPCATYLANCRIWNFNNIRWLSASPFRSHNWRTPNWIRHFYNLPQRGTWLFAFAITVAREIDLQPALETTLGYSDALQVWVAP